MKITSQHYDIVKTEMDKVINDNIKAEYKKAGLSNDRFAWDTFHGSVSSIFICKVLYKYLNDGHIKTAILRIVGKY